MICFVWELPSGGQGWHVWVLKRRYGPTSFGGGANFPRGLRMYFFFDLPIYSIIGSTLQFSIYISLFPCLFERFAHFHSSVLVPSPFRDRSRNKAFGEGQGSGNRKGPSLRRGLTSFSNLTSDKKVVWVVLLVRLPHALLVQFSKVNTKHSVLSGNQFSKKYLLLFT